MFHFFYSIPDSLLLLLGQRVLARGRPHRPRRRGDERHDAPTRGDSTVHGARIGRGVLL